jgi:plastocyanin
MSTLSLRRCLSACGILIVIAACRGDKQSPSAADTGSKQATAQSTGPLAPAPGGKTIEVTMVSDGEGNYFQPKEVHANRGDVVRFKLKVGVHNVHFVADSNAGKSGFPTSPSEFLQLPGQTYDVAANMEPGTYYFQCDPHAMLGMMGRLIVH